MPDQWPTSAEVHLAVGERLARLLDEHGGPVAEVGRRTLSGAHGLFSDRPHSLTTVLVPGACIAAGGTWRAAIWPAAAAELMMAAADLFDDVADADPGAPASDSPGVVLTAARSEERRVGKEGGSRGARSVHKRDGGNDT